MTTKAFYSTVLSHSVDQLYALQGTCVVAAVKVHQDVLLILLHPVVFFYIIPKYAVQQNTLMSCPTVLLASVLTNIHRALLFATV
jgi:hypothetical protein